MAQSQHPHHASPTPPAGWLNDGGETLDLPPSLIPSVRLQGAQFVDLEFHDVTIGDALKKFFATSDFPTASTDFSPDAKETDYGHLFIRDAAYGLMMLKGTDWPERLGRPQMVRNFLKLAYGYQGKVDVPNIQQAGTANEWVANDGEKPGRLPHEIWPTWTESVNARYLAESFGWTWPIYFGAVDTTPLVCMMTAREAKDDPSYLLERVEHIYNDGTTSTNTVLQCWVDAVRHIVDECDVTLDNPEGLYETTAMSNLCWGDWDDSYDIIRDRKGEVAHGKVTHVELMAFARSALMGLTEFADGLDASTPLNAHLRAMLRSAGATPTFLTEARNTADRLGDGLTEHLLVRDDPQYGTYFALGVDRDVETGELRMLDVCTAKPALMLLVDPQHLPEGVAEIVIEQTLDPANGLLCENGISNLSQSDPFFGDDVYHNILWPDKVGLIAAGLENFGAHGAANEVHARNWVNFIDPFVRGYQEFLRTGTDRPLPVQRDVRAEVIGSQPPWSYDVVKHAMGGQFWALAASARWSHQAEKAWSGQLPNRATNPALKAVEHRVMGHISEDLGLKTDALYFRHVPSHAEFKTVDETAVLDHPESGPYEVPVVRTEGGYEPLIGQRMPGEQGKGRDGLSIADNFRP